MTSNFYLGGEIVTGETVTHTYSYDDADWADLLTAYDGHSLTYDAIGNPLTYYNGSSYTMTWAKGRQLSSASRGSSSASYAYDMDGIRTSKTVNGVTTEFITQNGRVVRQSWSGNVLDFFYDSQQRPYAVTYKPADGAAATYYYITNLQGDVVALIDSSGSLAAEYTYNAWGAPLTMPYGGAGAGAVWPPIAELNPLRYRGYYYDAETGLYYVSSRYYDPEIGRWINADALVDQSSVLGYNLFAYCRNNPVNMTDTTGNLPFFAITAAIGAVVGAVVGGVVAAKNGGNVWAGIGIGAAAGALIGTGAGMAAGAALAGSITATTGAVMAGGSTLVATVGTGGLGAGANYIANNLSQAANNLAPAAQTTASKMQQVYEKGKAGELAANITKNHAHIDSLTGTAKYRIPDMLDRSARILGEVKNYSGTISLTAQLKDFALWSQLNGYQMHLYTNSTSFTGPLQQLIDNGVIQVFPIG